MALTQELTTQIGAACVGAVALASPVAAASLAPVALPLVEMAAIGLHLKDGCAKKASEKAQKAIIKALKGQPEFPPETLSRALSLLKDADSPLSLSKETLLAAAQSGNFEGEVVQHLLTPLTLDRGESAVRQILETALHAGLGACRQDESFHQALTQELLIKAAHVANVQLEQLDEIKADTTEIISQNEQTHDLLKQILAGHVPEGLTLEQLHAVATQFKVVVKAGDTPATILQNLSFRAQEIEALEQQLAQMQSQYPLLSNAIAEAQAKLKQGDTQAVRKMVRDARVVLRDAKLLEALEQDAQLVEIDASALLIEGDPEAAFQILSAAADSFRSINPLLPCIFRNTKSEILFTYGRIHGGDAMALTVKMLKDALSPLTQKSEPKLWGSININIAAALCFKSSDFIGAARLDILKEAKTACRNALRIYIKEKHKVDWAIIQSCLSMIYGNQASVSKGEAKQNLLTKSKSAASAAWEVFGFNNEGISWAATIKINLAHSLLLESELHQNNIRLLLLEGAKDASSDALQLISAESAPENWAAAQTNLANTMSAIALISSPDKFDITIEQSIDAHKKVSDHFSAKRGSIQWVQSQIGLGKCRLVQAGYSGGEITIEQANMILRPFENAANALSKKQRPVLWAQAQLGKTIALFLQMIANSCIVSISEPLFSTPKSIIREIMPILKTTKQSNLWAYANFLLLLMDALEGNYTQKSKKKKLDDAITKNDKVLGEIQHDDLRAGFQLKYAIVRCIYAMNPNTKSPRTDLKAALTFVDKAISESKSMQMAHISVTAIALRDYILKALSD